MTAYPARFETAQEGGFVVEFVDIPTCVTQGDTLGEAEAMAKEALTGVLACMASMKIKIPQPSQIAGVDIRYIEPDLKNVFTFPGKQKRKRLRTAAR